MTDAEQISPPGEHGAIRPVRSEDTSALKAVIEATDLFPSELLDGMVGRYLEGAEDTLWLTFDDGEPVAVAYAAPEQMTEGTWNLLLIAVHPDSQGQGTGGALLGRVEENLLARGVRLLLVETSGLPSFQRTRAFYRDRGYDEEARIRDYYEDGDDKVVFRKALGGQSG